MNQYTIEQLVNILKGDESAHLSATELSAYVDAQMQYADDDPAFEQTRIHLDSCVRCAEQYATLYDEAFDALVAQVRVPPLPFLRRDPTLLERLQQAVRTQMTQVGIQFSAALNELLQPPPLATVRSGTGRYERQLLQLSTDDTAIFSPSLPYGVTVFADAEDATAMLVQVSIQPPDKEWPDLDGYRVTLTTGEISTTQETDAQGEVAFADVPRDALSDMQITIAT